MELLYIGNYMFQENKGVLYGLPSSSDEFFSKYLSVFDKVRVLGEPLKNDLSVSNLVKLSNDCISVRILPPNRSPKDIKNDRYVKNVLKEEIANSDAIIIKPLSRKGIMAIRLAEKLKKPYMVELTGDIHNALLQNPSRIKRAYAPILYSQIKKAIKNCRYGLYVSESYLQSKYPISGKMCGCSDVVLEKADDLVLEKRLNKIDDMDINSRIDLCLVGFYQGNGKGVDTAIRALSGMPENVHFTILGNGTEENRKKWIEYGKSFGVFDRIHFDEPLASATEVLKWMDNFDVFVFPTRSEGLPRCLVEAMSRGLPCFATDICTMPELLPKECLHSLDDDKTLAELVMKYVYDKELLKKAAKANFEKAKQYDVDILKQRRTEFLSEFREYCENYKKES